MNQALPVSPQSSYSNNANHVLTNTNKNDPLIMNTNQYNEFKYNDNDDDDDDDDIQLLPAYTLYQSSTSDNQYATASVPPPPSSSFKNVHFAPSVGSNNNGNNIINRYNRASSVPSNINSNYQQQHYLDIENIKLNSLQSSISSSVTDNSTLSSPSNISNISSINSAKSNSNSNSNQNQQQVSVSFRKRSQSDAPVVYDDYNKKAKASVSVPVSVSGSDIDNKYKRQMIRTSQIKSCPNLVNNKCRCKEILSQNKDALRIWLECSRRKISNPYHIDYKHNNRELNVAYFDGMYGLLCKYFQYQCNTDRVPIKHNMSHILKLYGGFIVDDHNTLVIDRCNYIDFWSWFRYSCDIVKDLYNLWDDKFPFKMNLFINRADCQNILNAAPKGTFMLRLSQRNENCLVLSYVEPSMNKLVRTRHLLLTRISNNQYITKTNMLSHHHHSSTLPQLIRSFTKLKYVYTPTHIHKKNVVF